MLHVKRLELVDVEVRLVEVTTRPLSQGMLELGGASVKIARVTAKSGMRTFAAAKATIWIETCLRGRMLAHSSSDSAPSGSAFSASGKHS